MSFDAWENDFRVIIHYQKFDNGIKNEIVKICKKFYSDYNPKVAIPYNGGFLVNLEPKEVSNFTIMEWHYVDLEKKKMTGSIPVSYLFDDQGFVNAVKTKVITLDDQLCHHGIKGQKWGVRRYQNSDGSLTPAGREHYGYGKKRAEKILSKNNDVRYSGAALATSTGFAKQLLRTGARMIPGVGLALAVKDAASLTKQLVDSSVKAFSSEEKQNAKLKKYADIEHVIKNEKDVNKIEGYHDEKSDMTAVNPSYRKIMSSVGSSNNCMFCTTAYDLRRRGFDVTAKAGFGRATSDVTKWYKGAKVQPSGVSSWKEFAKKLSIFPDGARGNLMVTPAKDFSAMSLGNSGHSMIWEKQNGKVLIKDAQVNKTYKPESFHMANTWDVKTAKFVRTDNCEPNWAMLNEAVANRVKK